MTAILKMIPTLMSDDITVYNYVEFNTHCKNHGIGVES